MNKKILTPIIMGIMLLGMLFWAVPPSIFAPNPARNPETTASTISTPSTSEELPSTDAYKKITHPTMENTILMVIAFKDFRDEEYLQPKKVFEQAGFSVATTSTKTGRAEGSYGTTVIVDTDINQINPDDYEAVVFCGGGGMGQELDNPVFQKLAQDFSKADKPVTAICIAPALLAKAGLLQDKEATVWASPLDRSAVKILEANGAIYKEESVVRDGSTITANGPAAAEEFGEAIVQLLNN